MLVTNPSDLIESIILKDQQEAGHEFRVRIVEAINAHEDKMKNNPELPRFKSSINNDQLKEVMVYNSIV